MEVFFIIIGLLVFGVEEILHEQRASQQRADENMKIIHGWNNRNGKRK